MSRKALSLVCLTVSLLLGAPAQADQIVTVNGTKIRGQIVKATSREVQIRDSRGLVMTVPRDEIQEIIKEDNKAVFAERFEELKDSDFNGLIALAKWAKKNGLKDQSKSCLKRVLKSDPEHPKARKRLGYEKVDGKWLRGSKLRAAKGLVKYKGKWITTEERDRREAATSVRASAPKASAVPGEPAAAPKRVIVLPEEDDALLSIVRGSGPLPRRLEAAKTLSSKGGDARAALQTTLEQTLAKAKKKLKQHFTSSKGKIRGKLAKRIVKRRKEAKSIIFDKAKYPDANHGAAGQHLVDAAVGKLMRSYDDPLSDMQDDDAVAKLISRVTQTAGWLRQFCAAPVSDQAVLSEIRGEVSKAIGMRRFPVDATDGKILKASLVILKYNKGVKTSLTDEERSCVYATNEYRMMFGLKALKVFEPLVQAARGHSTEMLQLGFFDHNSPTPANRTPSMRCKRAGATFAGENIAMGMQSGRGAFNAWYTSSGHHRNMLTKTHRSIGIGRNGKYWTQNFGYDNPKP